MKQLTLASASFERYAKTTRRAVFLGEMERVVPWPALYGLIAPVYPKPGNGRPPVGVERMLRIYFLQQWRHRGVVDENERAKNRTKSKVRAKVEHPIGVIKRVFGFAKVRYRGLKKNAHRLLVTCALANLFMARRYLMRCQGA
jgi:hypothetical protein